MINENRVVFLLVALLSIGGVFVSNYPPRALSREAVIRCRVGADLVIGETRGRQGLVGSLHWAPLPTLLVLPMMASHELASTGLAACLVAALAAALLAAFINQWLTSAGVGRLWRYAALALLAANPLFERSILRGESGLLFALLVTASCCFFIRWLQTLELRSLAYLSILCALLVLTRYQAVVFVALVFVIALIYLLVEREKPAYTEATLLLLLSPTVYAVGLWFAANWLIMGDPLFFVRGLRLMVEQGADWRAALADRCEWAYCLLPLFLCLLSWIFTQLPSTRALALVRGLALVGLAFLGFWTERGRPQPLLTAQERRANDELDAVVADLETRYRDDKVAVSGYLGYEIRRRVRTYGWFIHLLNIHLDEVLRQTRGQQLYLLVPADVGDGFWEDVNLTYPGIYENGAAFAIFERAWPHWRLFRVVRTDLRASAVKEVAEAGK